MPRSSLSKISPVGLILLAALVLTGTLAAWAASSPMGSSPDDDFHLTSIWCGQGVREGLCEESDSSKARFVPVSVVATSACFAYKPAVSGDCAASQDLSLIKASRLNTDGSYPPLFYWVMSAMASRDVVGSAFIMRLVNIILFVGIGILTFMLVPIRLRWPMVLGAIVSSVPLGLFILASVNPSSWAIISMAFLWPSLTAFQLERRPRRSAALAVLSIALATMGAGARADAAAYAALAAVISMVLVALTDSWSWRRALLPISVIVFMAAMFLSAGQSGAVSSQPVGEANVSLLLMANLVMLPSLWIGAFGSYGLGWLDTQLPAIVWSAVLFAWGGLAFTGLKKVNVQKAVASLISFAALVAVPMYVYVHDRTYVGLNVQPRYILPLIILLLGVLLLKRRGVLSLSLLQLVLVGTLLAGANAVALHENIRRYVTGQDVQSLNLNAGVEWWWEGTVFSPMSVWILGSMSFAGFLALLAIGYINAQKDLEVKSPVS